MGAGRAVGGLFFIMILVLLAPPPDSPRMRAQTGLTEVGVSIRLIEIGSN